MLALLGGEAAQRGVPICALTFDPIHATTSPPSRISPISRRRIGTLRDKLTELARYGVQQAVVLPFDARLVAISPGIHRRGTGTRPGRTLRAGGRRLPLRQAACRRLRHAGCGRGKQGFDVARMMSYEVHGLRVSSSEVRAALAAGRMQDAAQLLGRPTPSRAMWCMAASSGARWAPAPPMRATVFAP